MERTPKSTVTFSDGINLLDIQAVPDTGCELTMLHTRVLDALRDYFGYKPPIIDNDSIKVADAQGKAVPTVGEVTLSTTIGSVTKNLSFLVSSNINEYCILSWMDCIQLYFLPAPDLNILSYLEYLEVI